jgi:virginiamycin B lyase
MNHLHSAAMVFVALASTVGTSHAADAVLSGGIRSASGERLEGITVSAKREGSTITTAVYTDKSGRYVFPALAEGKYRVWAQALGFETAKQEVDLAPRVKQDFTLAQITDAERRYRQLPSEAMVAALPADTPQDAHMKKVFTNNCVSCHPPSFALQFRFDEDGWKKIIDLMKMVPVTGVYPGPNAKPNQVIAHFEQPLAAYLARARGPGESSMKLTPPKRPTGEATRAVWTLYDIAWNPDAGLGAPASPNDGSDWSMGTTSKLGQMNHDGGIALDGNLYFTVNSPNTAATVGKVDRATGKVTWLKVDGKNGAAAGAHGLARDPAGNFWFDATPGKRTLAKLDPTTDKITVYPTPEGMSEVGGAVTVDIDGKGRVWASTPAGAVRFDPATEKYTEFKSLIPTQSAKGNGATYGTFADNDGNGFWAQMAMDTVYKADASTDKITAIKIPDAKMPKLSAEDRAFYETVSDLNFSNPLPWSPGPRRGAVDKTRGVLWVGNSWGASLARIDTHTNKVTTVPMPEPTMQAYHAVIDSKHRVWANLWTSDRLVRYDPDHKTWATFNLPVRGSEIRHISMLEKDGKISIVVPVYRTNQMGVLTVRSEAEMAQR